MWAFWIGALGTIMAAVAWYDGYRRRSPARMRAVATTYLVCLIALLVAWYVLPRP
ncbi:hypothetical protein [Consotaella salsifontis]|uniref:Uncharacterized protein n=1 Tax=Consotaella salsifontis TaxID=1365950 RepID=A0A1T4L898_9HYPH|nr:hypothetical protein [Consotaella salsifontis]SJZ50884.1 hypothetical protein SAMN05428963_101104 [Consotaella salsifontis]